MEKFCSKCNQTKDFVEFGKNKKRKYGLQNYCKQCQAEYQRVYYEDSDNKSKKASLVKQRQNAIREWMISFKKTKRCVKCGNGDFRVLDFHHKGDKLFSISDAVACGHSVKSLLEEIEKCECLCSNCHRIVTYDERHAAFV